MTLLVILPAGGTAYQPSKNIVCSSQTIFSSTFYVGGSGSNNYTSIQQAINFAAPGDHIYVFNNSSPYEEQIVVNKTIFLCGEDKASTIISGNTIDPVITITADSVVLSDFTIDQGLIGVNIQSNHTLIQDTFITNNLEEGIFLDAVSNTSVIYSCISENEDGIELANSQHSKIRYNNISTNYDHGIELISSENVAQQNLIQNNHITNNTIGIYLENSNSNNIIRNNFLDNQETIHFINSRNTWVHNFWEKGRILPKLIIGKILIGPLSLPWFTVDWRPATIQNTWFKTVESIIDTSLGIMTLELYYEDMPITASNFKNLADIDFFDGLVFHRTIEDFVIQGGGYYPNGTHKDSPFGPINLETHPNILHVDGAISMARTSNPNSATSQFFICDTAQPHLDGNYAAFGKVTDGFDVLRAISSVETTTKYGLQDWPVDDVIINSITVEDW